MGESGRKRVAVEQLVDSEIKSGPQISSIGDDEWRNEFGKLRRLAPRVNLIVSAVVTQCALHQQETGDSAWCTLHTSRDGRKASKVRMSCAKASQRCYRGRSGVGQTRPVDPASRMIYRASLSVRWVHCTVAQRRDHDLPYLTVAVLHLYDATLIRAGTNDGQAFSRRGRERLPVPRVSARRSRSRITMACLSRARV